MVYSRLLVFGNPQNSPNPDIALNPNRHFAIRASRNFGTTRHREQLSYISTTTMSEAVDTTYDTAEASQSKIQIRLTTRHSDIELPEDPGVLLVSTSKASMQLSTLEALLYLG
jgi:hypothetical protein